MRYSAFRAIASSSSATCASVFFKLETVMITYTSSAAQTSAYAAMINGADGMTVL